MRRVLLCLMVMVGAVMFAKPVSALPYYCEDGFVGEITSEQRAECESLRAEGGGGAGGSDDCGGSFLGLRPWYNGLTGDECEIVPPRENPNTDEGEISITSFVWVIITNILFDLFVVAGYLAVGFIMYGGYTYLVARGDPGRIEKGKKTIVAAVSGLVIAVLASVIVAFISSNILVE